MKTKLMTFRDTIILAMSEEMRRDSDILLLGEDVGIFGGDFGTSVGMLEEFGKERIRDCPISEGAITGLATGAAITGLRPIVDLTFMDFIVFAMDSLVNQAAKTKYMFGGKGSVPITIRCAAGNGVGSAAQHSQSLESWFTHIPGLKVVAPGTPRDMKGLLKSSIRDNNPVIILEYKSEFNQKGEVPLDPDFIIPLGVGEIKKEGTDISVITYGKMVSRVMKAASDLEKEGINVEVVDPRTLKPLDKNIIINSVKKTGRVVLVNDAHKTSGFIGEISAIISESEAFNYLKAPIKRCAGEDVPMPYAQNLEMAMIPTVESIKDAIRKTVKENSSRKIIEEDKIEEIQNSNTIKISPLAKVMAKMNNINLENIHGSGVHGKIMKADILNIMNMNMNREEIKSSISTPETNNKYGNIETIPMNGMRKIIAKRMLESTQNTPTFILNYDVDMSEVLALRKNIKDSIFEETGKKITITDIISLAVIKTLMKHKYLNASLSPDGENILIHDYVNLAIAVGFDGGLLTPAVYNAEKLTLSELVVAMKDITTRALNMKLSPSELKDSTFTISNLGMYGVSSFGPIINQPNSAVLGVSATVKKPVVIGDEIKIRPMMSLGLTVDHRVVDGLAGALFMQDLKTLLENPIKMLV